MKRTILADYGVGVVEALLADDDALDDEGVNIKQLGVGVGDTVPVGVGVGVSVALAVVVGVGVQGNIDDEELLNELALELELSAELLLAELELKPRLALDELELRPKPALDELPPNPSELELLKVEVLEPLGVPGPDAPALGPHATTRAAIATKATKTITNLFICFSFSFGDSPVASRHRYQRFRARRLDRNPRLSATLANGSFAVTFPLGRNEFRLGEIRHLFT